MATKKVLIKKRLEDGRVYDIYTKTSADIVQYTDADTVKDALDNVSAELETKATKSELDILNQSKVDKVTGMGLSSNDYTALEKSKLSGIETGAEVNVQSDWGVADSASDAYIKNKPTALPANGGNADTVNNHTVEANVPAGAKFTDTVYIHPTEDGYKHVPANGKTNNGKFLRATSVAGTYEWQGLSNTDITTALGYDPQDLPVTYTITKNGSEIYLMGSDGSSTHVTDENTTYGVATITSDGLESSEDKKKLNGIEAGANKYIHPSYTQRESGLYKITVDTQGHVSDATTVVKADITALGIPEADTWRPVQDNLTSTSNIDALSANQGKVLNETKLSHFYITTVTDFDTLTNTGVYHVMSANNTNAPTSDSGILIVDFDIANPCHIWIPDTIATYDYKRNYNGTTWDPWQQRKFTDTVYKHPASGVIAGTYKSVIVNEQGHITAGTNPTTLAEYGITDADLKGSADTALADAKSYTDEKIANLVGTAESTMDTLGELADALKNNSTITEALNAAITSKADAQDLTDHINDSTIHITADERISWDDAKAHADSPHAPSNAEKNQSAFSYVFGGSVLLSADSTMSTFGIESGDNVSISTDINTNKIKISAVDTVYGVGNAATYGLTKLYTSTGSNTDGTMTQNAITAALGGKANSSHGNHVPNLETADNAKFLRNDNTWAYVTPVNIGASAVGHTHTSIVNGVYGVNVNTSGYVLPVVGSEYLGKSDTPWASIYATTIYEGGVSLVNKYAALSHTHSYLSLAGGTVTGATVFSGTTASTSKSTGIVKIAGGLGVAGRSSSNEVMIGDKVVLSYSNTEECLDINFI